MDDCRLLRFGKALGCRAVGDDVGRGQRIGLAEAAVEARLLRLEAEEGEVGKADIELRLRVAVEIAALGACLLRTAASEPDRAAGNADARMGEGVALAGFAEEQRTARVGEKSGGMAGKRGDQDQRRTVEIGGDGDAARLWRAVVGA